VTQDTITIEDQSPAARSRSSERRISIRWRIAGAFAGVIVLVGVSVVAVVYHVMVRSLRTQVDQRAFAMAVNLSDAAAGYVVAGNSLALHALVAKYALFDEVAYTFVEDATGKVVSHSLGAFPAELKGALSPGGLRQTLQRTLSFRGKDVYETRVPILDGQVGAAHVGIWGDAVEGEIRAAILPLLGLIVVVLVAGVALALFVAGGISRPIRRLTKSAESMSRGDLDTPVAIHSRDEIGDLADSLERMRASLKAAMARLGRGSLSA
jgi:two-component system, cell cycle sensor histidine kinase and response regulator CckA